MTLRIDSLITVTVTLLVATTASAGGGALAALSEAYGAWDADAYTQDCQYEDHGVRCDREATAAVD